MKIITKRRLFASLLLIVLLLQQGCSLPVSTNLIIIRKTGEIHSPSTIPSATPFATITPLPTATPINPASTPNMATTNPPTTPVPTQPPHVSPNNIVNRFSAGDAKRVYYYKDNGIYSMNTDGSEDKKTKIKNFVSFLCFYNSILFYLGWDTNYVSSRYEDENFQFCNSYNLMMYDTKTMKITQLYKHIYTCLEADKLIYIIDHVDHKKLVLYDISSAKLFPISNVPILDNYYDMDFEEVNRVTYLTNQRIEGNVSYRINKGAVEETTASIPTPTYSPVINDLSIDGENRNVSVWNGVEYVALDMINVEDAFTLSSGSYVVTMKKLSEDENGKVDCILELNKVISENVIDKLLSGPAITYNKEGSNIFEMVNGWFFSFWEDGDGGTVSELLLKEKVE